MYFSTTIHLFSVDLTKWVALIKDGTYTAYRANQLSGIPKSTLHNHAPDRVQSCKRGRPALFSETQEGFLVDYIQTLARWGYPLDKKKVKDC